MPDNRDSLSGDFISPGGFVFGVQGWSWGEPRPRTITFFLDGTAKVCDQHGRPIRGTEIEGKKYHFALEAPSNDDPPGGARYVTVSNRREILKLATHEQVVAALEAEGIDWKKLNCAGWPQLPYEQLIELVELPPTPIEELRKIKNPDMRRAALRARREADEAKAKEMAELEEE